MTDYQAALRSFKPSHEYFVGIDSDGCCFDTMELKHKECFIPNIIRFYDLQAVSKYVREAAEFVNLYSWWRGVNRFPGLTLTLDLVKERPEVIRRDVEFKDTTNLTRFIESGKPLGNPALEAELSRSRSPDLQLALDWSRQVNKDVELMVHGVSPFPNVRDCFEKLSGVADRMVVSGTPVAALTREWQEHDLEKHVSLIAGQEVGSKKETLAAARAAGYAKDHILMVGDAPGDMKAAQANDALFFPVVPGEEEASWELLLEEGLDRFLDGSYAGDYEKQRIDSFLRKLPKTPPWKK